MHRIEEVKYHAGRFTLEVDENGAPLSFSAPKGRNGAPLYKCECGDTFASWEDAEAHAELYGGEFPSSGE